MLARLLSFDKTCPIVIVLDLLANFRLLSLTSCLPEPFQLPRLEDSNPAVSRLVKDITIDLPANLLSGIKVPKTSIHTPLSGPPGLSLSQDFPPLAAPQAAPPPKAQRKGAGTNFTSATIKPVIPVLPGQQNRTQVPAKDSRESQIVPPPEGIDAPASYADAEPSPETTGTKSGLKSKPKTKLPAANSRKNPRSKNVTDVLTTKVVLPAPAESDTKSIPQKATERRHPGKLDIAAAKDASKKDLESVATSSSQNKSAAPASVSSAISRPATPATAVSQASGASIVRQTQPRTIRVLPTPKVETPPRLNPASPSVVNAAASIAAGKQQSRRASPSSIHPPGTPASEKISDNASFTSASMSRANSPPPSKVGSAPVRQVTKSQQKKERQVRAKLAEECSKNEGSSVKAIAEMPVQAPIVGRKKKAKKATRGTADSTPMVTRPSSPTPKDEGPQEKAVSRPVTPVKENKKDFILQKHHQEPDTPASPVASLSGDHHQKNVFTAASILSSLQKSGDVSSAIQDLFKGVSGVNYRFELTRYDLTEPELIPPQIENGEAITLELANNKRVVLLPDRRTLHGLTKEQAQRYLDLRKKALSTAEPAMFNSSRHDIDRYLHAVSHTAAPTLPKPTATSSREDLFELINQFVVSASAPACAAATMPSYWSAAPLTAEAMARKLSIRSIEDAEQAMLASRKETEGLEKKLNGLLKRNRRLIFGNSH